MWFLVGCLLLESLQKGRAEQRISTYIMYGLYTHLFISVCVCKTCKHPSNKSNYTGNKKAPACRDCLRKYPFWTRLKPSWISLTYCFTFVFRFCSLHKEQRKNTHVRQSCCAIFAAFPSDSLRFITCYFQSDYTHIMSNVVALLQPAG